MKNIAWWRTDFGETEIQGIAESIRNEHISQGLVTERFEEAVSSALEIPYVVATTSGSMALLMALMALGIKQGDEVIVPNRTWIATAHAPMMLGAKVVLCDVLPDLPIMDVSQIRQKITSRTKAILPVPLNGRAVDMEQVWKIADEFGFYVIEDAAQALFCKNSGAYMGTRSDAGCFSLSMAKLIPTGQGGFVVTRNIETYEKLRRIRTHGVDDVINCTYHQMGFNFRYTDLQASIGLVQLSKVTERINRMKAVYEKYRLGLAGIESVTLIPVDVREGQIPLYVEVLCNEREDLMKYLASHSIQTRPSYPDLDSALHLNSDNEFPNTRVFGKQGLVLPCGPDQPFENVDRVLEELKLYGEQETDA